MQVGASNRVMVRSLDFDPTTQEYAQFSVRMPKAWDEGTISFQPYWTANTGNTGGVVWSLRGVCLANDDGFDAAWGSVSNSALTYITTNDMHAGPSSGAITIAGTPAANDMCMYEVSREVGNASDTLVADAKLIGVALFFTINAGDDT